MKAMIVAALALIAAPHARAASFPNAKAVAEIQQLIFGNVDKKTEVVELKGTGFDDQDCTVEARKTRWGVYLTVKLGEEQVEAGVTNSHKTSDELVYSNDPQLGQLKASSRRMTGINERGEDYSQQDLSLTYQSQAGGRGDLQVVEVKWAELEIEYGDAPDYTPTYHPTGNVKHLICTIK